VPKETNLLFTTGAQPAQRVSRRAYVLPISFNTYSPRWNSVHTSEEARFRFSAEAR